MTDRILRQMISRMREIERRLNRLENVEITPVGEAAGNAAYYRLADGSLYPPGDLHLSGDVYLSGSMVGSILGTTPIWGRWQRTSAQSVANGSQYDVVWTTEDADTDSMWSSGANININTTGSYMLIGEIQWADNTDSTSRQAIIYKGAGTLLAQLRIPALSGADTHQIVGTIAYLLNTDTVKLTGRQQSGGNLNLVTATLAVGKIV